MLVSIVITSDSDPEVVRLFLDAVKKISNFPDALMLQVVVVDDLGVLDEGFCSGYRCSFDLVLLGSGNRHGQLAALVKGVSRADGEVVVTMDPDMHRNVADIERFIAEYKRGYHLVFAWRVRRRGVSGTRIALTAVFNAMARIIGGMTLRDFNTSMILLSRQAVEMLETMPAEACSARLYMLHRMAGDVTEVQIETEELPGRKSTYSRYGRILIFFERLMEVIRFRIYKHKIQA